MHSPLTYTRELVHAEGRSAEGGFLTVRRVEDGNSRVRFAWHIVTLAPQVDAEGRPYFDEVYTEGSAGSLREAIRQGRAVLRRN